ncbi:MAG: hypothetical protein ABFS86_10735 [Planctomycetota bacterium]
MESETRSASPLLRAYALLAALGWFVGIPATLVLSGVTGKPPWPMFLVIAGSVPLVPLLILKGPEILGDGLAKLVGGRRGGAPAAIVWAIALILMAGLCFFAWATREEGLARERVRAFVRGLGENAHVLVDGEYFLGERKRILLEPLADLGSLPAHHSHPEEAFLVVLLDGEERLELELCRDSERRREYWVYLLGGTEFREMNEIGRITTEVLDDLVPVRPPRSRRKPGQKYR